MAIKLKRPKSYAADLAFKLVKMAIPFQIIAVLLHRVEFISSKVFFALIGVGFLFALGAILCAIIAYISLWRVAAKGGVKATLSLVIALAMFAPIGLSIWQNSPLPDVNDITTDIKDRPLFSQISSVRDLEQYPIRPWGRKQIEIHKKSYPNLKSHFYDTSLDETLKVIYAVAKKRGWTIVSKPEAPVENDDAADGADNADGTGGADNADGEDTTAGADEEISDELLIEATWRSLVIGFKNDAAIRLIDENERTRVDIRSAARAGRYDFKANAKEIQAFLDILDKEILSFSRKKPQN